MVVCGACCHDLGQPRQCPGCRFFLIGIASPIWPGNAGLPRVRSWKNPGPRKLVRRKLEIELDAGGCFGERFVFNFVEDCLNVFTKLWARGDYGEAEVFAEKAARMDPTNVKARHALVVAEIVNAALTAR